MVEAPATVELNFALPPVAVAPIVIVSTDTAPEIVATLGASSPAEFKTANSVAPLVSDIAPATVIASVLLLFKFNSIWCVDHIVRRGNYIYQIIDTVWIEPYPWEG